MDKMMDKCERCGSSMEEIGYINGAMHLQCPQCGYITTYKTCLCPYYSLEHCIEEDCIQWDNDGHQCSLLPKGMKLGR